MTVKQDGSYYKTSSMKSIRAAIDRFLRSPPHCKQFSIIGDPAFIEASQVLVAFMKDLQKMGKIAGMVHKKPIAKQQIQRLYECGELGPANSTNPAQLQRTVWFYLVLYFGQQGREYQRQMKSNIARNVSFRISLRWLIHIINLVDKTQLSRYTSHRRSTTVSLETYPSSQTCLFSGKLHREKSTAS